MKYWLGVVSKEHVLRGVEGGFAQVCHGKKVPLSKMSKGDGFVYYSPKISMDRAEVCKCFTAVGTIKSGEVYQVEMFPDFHPFRIDIEYLPSRDVAIADISELLELTKCRSWGMQLLKGHLEISQSDFEVIRERMHFPS